MIINLMDIYLLRHGETDWNRAGRIQGHTDIPLNQHGREQIVYTAEILASLHIDIDLILTSPLSRAYESAQIIAAGLSYAKEDIVVEPLLKERSFGMGEGLTALERKEKYPDGVYPKMETREALRKRALMAFDKVREIGKDKGNILIVAHGAILHAVMAAVIEGYGNDGKKDFIDHGFIYRIRVSEGSLELAKYNNEEAQWSNL